MYCHVECLLMKYIPSVAGLQLKASSRFQKVSPLACKLSDSAIHTYVTIYAKTKSTD